MMKEKFYSNFENSEIETHIWIDYSMSNLRIETNRKLQYERLLNKLGEPTKKQYIKSELCSAYWDIPFINRKKINNALSITLLIRTL